MKLLFKNHMKYYCIAIAFCFVMANSAMNIRDLLNPEYEQGQNYALNNNATTTEPMIIEETQDAPTKISITPHELSDTEEDEIEAPNAKRTKLNNLELMEDFLTTISLASLSHQTATNTQANTNAKSLFVSSDELDNNFAKPTVIQKNYKKRKDIKGYYLKCPVCNKKITSVQARHYSSFKVKIDRHFSDSARCNANKPSNEELMKMTTYNNKPIKCIPIPPKMNSKTINKKFDYPCICGFTITRGSLSKLLIGITEHKNSRNCKKRTTTEKFEQEKPTILKELNDRYPEEAGRSELFKKIFSTNFK